MSPTATSIPSAPAIPAVTRWPGLVAMALGAVFILGAGFSHSAVVHNAAHDARHAAGFPCH